MIVSLTNRDRIEVFFYLFFVCSCIPKHVESFFHFYPDKQLTYFKGLEILGLLLSSTVYAFINFFIPKRFLNSLIILDSFRFFISYKNHNIYLSFNTFCLALGRIFPLQFTQFKRIFNSSVKITKNQLGLVSRK